MPVNENPPHVRRIETDRPDACAFEVTGHISAADVENMYGLLEGAFELHDRIDLLVIVRDYEGLDWSIAFSDTTLAGKMQALRHIRRYAVVGGPAWMRTMMGFFKPFLSIEMRHFESADTEAAWQWLEAGPLED